MAGVISFIIRRYYAVVNAKWTNLLGFAAVALPTQVVIYQLMKQHYQSKYVKECDWFKEAIDILKHYPEAINIVGEPMEVKGFRLWKTFSDDPDHLDDTEMKLSVPIIGPKTSIMLRMFATKEPEDTTFKIDHLRIRTFKDSYFFWKKKDQEWTFYRAQDQVEKAQDQLEKAQENSTEMKNNSKGS